MTVRLFRSVGCSKYNASLNQPQYHYSIECQAFVATSRSFENKTRYGPGTHRKLTPHRLPKGTVGFCVLGAFLGWHSTHGNVVDRVGCGLAPSADCIGLKSLDLMKSLHLGLFVRAPAYAFAMLALPLFGAGEVAVHANTFANQRPLSTGLAQFPHAEPALAFCCLDTAGPNEQHAQRSNGHTTYSQQIPLNWNQTAIQSRGWCGSTA